MHQRAREGHGAPSRVFACPQESFLLIKEKTAHGAEHTTELKKIEYWRKKCTIQNTSRFCELSTKLLLVNLVLFMCHIYWPETEHFLFYTLRQMWSKTDQISGRHFSQLFVAVSQLLGFIRRTLLAKGTKAAGFGLIRFLTIIGHAFNYQAMLLFVFRVQIPR